MDLLFLSPEFLVFLFLTVDLHHQLKSASLLRPELKNILQSLAGMPVCVIIDVLAREAIPVIDLAFTAPVFNSALESQCSGVIRFNLQSLLQFLKGEWIFFLFKPRTGGVQQLRECFSPDRAIELPPERANGSVHVAFGLEFAENFSCELKIAFLQRFGSTLQPRTSAFGIEELDRLVA